MKLHPKEVPDIIENLRELAAHDALLRYTLERLALQTPTNRKHVLDALKTGKPGRPNRQASAGAMFKEAELSIENFRPEVNALIKRDATEKEIIEWAIKKKYFRSEKAGDTPKKMLKRIQDGLARYRKKLSQKPP